MSVKFQIFIKKYKILHTSTYLAGLYSKNSTVHSPQTYKNLSRVFMLNFRLLDNISPRQQPLVHTNSSKYRSSSNSHKCMTAKTSNYTSSHSSWMSQAGKMPCNTSTVLKHKKKKRRNEKYKKIAFISGTTMIYDTSGWLIILTFLLLLLFLVPKASNSLTLKKIVAIFSIFMF